ncbi:hypothetical protein SELMODRAFT_420525 [Selaginella moellendorffii]|uniref:Uncharacterized protein n=1 Tax=Selaginella moellendorffii TaxID=88036 RepID=D8SC99_SELML|nr:hypothetical protein SELMODRAFT_420525 [Selaginella moellendorffii]
MPATPLPPLPSAALVPIPDSHDVMDPSPLMPPGPAAPGSSNHAMTTAETGYAPVPPAPVLQSELGTTSRATSSREHSQLLAEAIYDERASHRPLSPYLKRVLDTRRALRLRTTRVITAHIETRLENLEQDDTLSSVANFFCNEALCSALQRPPTSSDTATPQNSSDSVARSPDMSRLQQSMRHGPHSAAQERCMANTAASPTANCDSPTSEQEVSQAEGTEHVAHVEHVAVQPMCRFPMPDLPRALRAPRHQRDLRSFYVANFPYRYVRSQFQDTFESLLRDRGAYPHGVLPANPGPLTAERKLREHGHCVLSMPRPAAPAATATDAGSASHRNSPQLASVRATAAADRCRHCRSRRSRAAAAAAPASQLAMPRPASSDHHGQHLGQHSLPKAPMLWLVAAQPVSIVSQPAAGQQHHQCCLAVPSCARHHHTLLRAAMRCPEPLRVPPHAAQCCSRVPSSRVSTAQQRAVPPVTRGTAQCCAALPSNTRYCTVTRGTAQQHAVLPETRGAAQYRLVPPSAAQQLQAGHLRWPLCAAPHRQDATEIPTWSH